jgi:hypothetical protein
MAKLTKAQQRTITLALGRLEAAQRYILKPETRVVVVSEHPIKMFPADEWTNGEGAQGVSVNKEIGSDLAGLHHAVHLLRTMLD